MTCPSCQMLSINGIPCHETGCPDAWRTETRECKWCGSEFQPEDRFDQFCDGSCHAHYDGEAFPCDCEWCDRPELDSEDA